MKQPAQGRSNGLGRLEMRSHILFQARALFPIPTYGEREGIAIQIVRLAKTRGWFCLLDFHAEPASNGSGLHPVHVTLPVAGKPLCLQPSSESKSMYDWSF